MLDWIPSVWNEKSVFNTFENVAISDDCCLIYSAIGSESHRGRPVPNAHTFESVPATCSLFPLLLHFFNSLPFPVSFLRTKSTQSIF